MDIEKQITEKLFYDDTPLSVKKNFINKLKKKAKLIENFDELDVKKLKVYRLRIYQYKNFLYKIEIFRNVKNQKEKIDIYKIEIKKE